MKKGIFTLLLFISCLTLIRCSSENPRDKAYNQIKSMMNSDSIAKSANRGLYMDSLIRACEQFVAAYPNDSVADLMLMQTANFQVTQQRYRLALVQLDKLMKIYPNSLYIPAALYLKGDIFNSFLNKPDEALKNWDELITKYPNDKWAEEAKTMKDMIGLTPEEMLKKILSNKEAEKDSSQTKNK